MIRDVDCPVIRVEVERCIVVDPLIYPRMTSNDARATKACLRALGTHAQRSIRSWAVMSKSDIMYCLLIITTFSSDLLPVESC